MGGLPALSYWDEELLKATKVGDLKKVEECLFSGANVNCIEYATYGIGLFGENYSCHHCDCPLYYAVSKNYVEIVKLLLEYGADVYIASSYIVREYGKEQDCEENKTYILNEAKNDEIRQLLLKAANLKR